MSAPHSAIQMIPAAVRSVLAHWPLVAAGAEITSVTPGFSGASVHRIVADAGDFALRGWPTDEFGLPRERIQELHRWLAWLAADGITTVAVPMCQRGDATLVVHNGRLWQLEPWLPGVADFSAQPTDLRLRAACSELALWHRAAERYAPSREGERWFSTGRGVVPAVTERLEKLGRYITLLARAKAEVSA